VHLISVMLAVGKSTVIVGDVFPRALIGLGGLVSSDETGARLTGAKTTSSVPAWFGHRTTLRFGGLLAFCAVLLGGMSDGHAQNATWSTAPGSNDPSVNTNWLPATVPTGTTIFGGSTVASILFPASFQMSVNAFQFNAGAPSYSFDLTENSGNFPSLTFTGAGIINGSSNAPSFSMTRGSLHFLNSSSAANAQITNSGVVTSTVLISGIGTEFLDSSTAGQAKIVNNVGGVTFRHEHRGERDHQQQI
jgi:hypothetical protein